MSAARSSSAARSDGGVAAHAGATFWFTLPATETPEIEPEALEREALEHIGATAPRETTEPVPPTVPPESDAAQPLGTRIGH